MNHIDLAGQLEKFGNDAKHIAKHLAEHLRGAVNNPHLPFADWPRYKAGDTVENIGGEQYCGFKRGERKTIIHTGAEGRHLYFTRGGDSIPGFSLYWKLIRPAAKPAAEQPAPSAEDIKKRLEEAGATVFVVADRARGHGEHRTILYTNAVDVHIEQLTPDRAVAALKAAQGEQCVGCDMPTEASMQEAYAKDLANQLAASEAECKRLNDYLYRERREVERLRGEIAEAYPMVSDWTKDHDCKMPCVTCDKRKAWLARNKKT